MNPKQPLFFIEDIYLEKDAGSCNNPRPNGA